MLHEIIHEGIIREISILVLIDLLIDLVDKVNRFFKIFHDRILWDLLGVVNLFVVDEGLVKFHIFLAHGNGLLHH